MDVTGRLGRAVSARHRPRGLWAAASAGATPEVSDSEEGSVAGVRAVGKSRHERNRVCWTLGDNGPPRAQQRMLLWGSLETAFLSFQRNWLKEQWEHVLCPKDRVHFRASDAGQTLLARLPPLK